MRAVFRKHLRAWAPALPALFWAMLIFVAFPSPDARADETETEAGPVYQFPHIEPSYDLSGGYWFAHINGSRKAGEFDYPGDSLSLDGSLIAFPFPNRIHLEGDYLNPKDHFADLRYAYSDIVLFRFLDRGLYHNLPNIQLVDYQGTSDPVFRNDIGQEYGVGVGIEKAALRLKYPDYAFHLFAEGSQVQREGTVQEIFLGGSGWFVPDLDRTSEARDIDWTTRELTVGANGHFGPVEAEYSHTEKRFDSGPDSIPIYDYDASFAPSAAGDFPHNVIPDLSGSTNTLKLHTSYTGMIFGTVTISKTDRTNNLSEVTSSNFTGAGQLRIIPVTPLVITLKYRHDETDENTPLSLPIWNSTLSTLLTPALIMPAIDTSSDLLAMGARYRPARNAFFGVDVSAKYTRRDNAEAWGLPGSTTLTVFDLYADYKPVTTLNMRATYTHKNYDDPEYNEEPNNSDAGTLALTWIPSTRVTIFANYELANEHRDDIVINGEPSPGEWVDDESAHNRNVLRDKADATITVLLMKELSCTAGYSYWHDHVRQDLVFQNESGVAVPDPDDRYSEVANSYNLGANYISKKFSLSPQLSYTQSQSGITPGAAGDEAATIAGFSVEKTTEVAFSVKAGYEIAKGYKVALNYIYRDYMNNLDNPANPYVTSSTAHIVFISLVKRW